VNGYDITIKKSSAESSSTAKSHTNGVVQTKMSQPVQTKEVVVEKEVEVKSVAWWMLAAAFALGMLFMYVLKWLPRVARRRATPYNESEALKILYGHMSEDAKIEEMVRKLYARKNGDKSVQIDKKALKEMVDRVKKR
jgi:hypothetical protein